MIPVISLASLETDPQAIGQAIVDAYGSMGFGYVVDHPIDGEKGGGIFSNRGGNSR